MSMLQFINSPFPDNHDGFDYSPKSFTDVQHEMSDKEQSAKERKLLSMLISVMQ